MIIFLLLWIAIGLASLCYWITKLQLVIKRFRSITIAAIAGPFTNFIIWYLHTTERDKDV
jgi:hypothetical protein